MKTNRWSPFHFANSKIAKNRVIVPPMASQTADNDGFVTSKTLEHYKNLSESKAGIIFVEYSFVHPSGKGESHQLGVHSDEQILGLRKIVEVLHRGGSLAGLQIVHTGGKADPKITGQALIGPSAVQVPVKGWTPEIPEALPRQNIPTYIQWYVESAIRARAAGFDLLEIHAAHGYGLNQWLSPITNQRTDEFGGSHENRQRLLLKIIQAIKTETPELIISVRIPGQDYYPGGISIKDMQLSVNYLEKAGVDLIHVSSGIGGWRRPEGKSGEGYLVKDASLIKQATTLPVIGVGGIEQGITIDQMLSQNKIDFAAVGRAILKAPKLWHLTELASK